MAMVSLSARDAQWLDLVADLMAAPKVDWPTDPVVRLLVETFDAPAGSYYGMAADGSLVQRQWPPELFAEHRAEIERWSAHDAPREHPVLRYYLATGDASAMQVADVPRRFADGRVHARWREWCAEVHGTNVQSQVALPVHVGPRANRSFLVGRADPFSGPEMDLCRRLQRVLLGLDRQLSRFAGWSYRAGGVGTEVAEAVRLTPREVVVLELLATGMTAGAIGHRLAIAERTVQKHLQRVYAKLGVDDRLTAVRRAQQIELLGRP